METGSLHEALLRQGRRDLGLYTGLWDLSVLPGDVFAEDKVEP